MNNILRILKFMNIALVAISMVMLTCTEGVMVSAILLCIAVVLLLIQTLLDNYMQKYGRGFEFISDGKRKNTIACMPFDKLPQRADDGSCGYDFYSPYNFTVKAGEQMMIWTDIKVFMLQNEAFILNVRSSQGKVKIRLANTQGWIDSTYYNNPDNEGNIGMLIENNGSKDYSVNAGEKFCQGMFTNYLITGNDRPVSKVRAGGFGSSGK